MLSPIHIRCLVLLALSSPLGYLQCQSKDADTAQDPRAQFSLGLKYALGSSVPQDWVEAAKWFRKAAGQGNAEAQFCLGVDYFVGSGVKQDDIQAHMWLNLAAARVGGDAHKSSSDARDKVAKNMTPEQLAEAQRLAREWKPKQPNLLPAPVRR